MIKFEDEDEDNDGTHRINMISIAKETNTTKRLLTTRGLVSGFNMLIGFDSGATASVLSRKSVNKYGIKLNPSNLKVKTASGEIVEITGVTDSLLVDIKGHSCSLKLMVIDHDDHDVLLGLDWFEMTGAGLYPRLKMLRFPGETIYLNADQEDSYDIEALTEDVIENETEDVLVTEVTDEIDIAEDSDWSVQKGMRMIPVEKLDPEELNEFNACLRDSSEMFASGIMDLGACSVFKHAIRTTSEIPVHVPPYRKSEAERRLLREEMKKMLEANIIRPSRSPWSAPVIIIPKKDGTKRLCIDYRRLNAITITESWPLPNILDILDRLNGSTWFSALDLKSGYWQIMMHEESIEKTAIQHQMDIMNF